MKFKNFNDVKIYSHPRSGSNYFAELIDLNFTNTGDYNNIYGGHGIAEEKVFENPDIIYLYIKRDFVPVSKSLYKMKDRFGLEVSSFETYLISKYKDIYNSRFNSLVRIKKNGVELEENQVSKHFARIDMFPEEYHEYHIQKWEALSVYKNVQIISYEDLIEDYEKVLLSIAIKFNLTKKSDFVNIEKPVGYFPVENGIKVRIYQLGNRVLKYMRRVRNAIK